MLVIRCIYDLAMCFNYEEANEFLIASREKTLVNISAGIDSVWPSDAMWHVTPEILVNPGPGAAFDWCQKVITWNNVDSSIGRIFEPLSRRRRNFRPPPCLVIRKKTGTITSPFLKVSNLLLRGPIRDRTIILTKSYNKTGTIISQLMKVSNPRLSDPIWSVPLFGTNTPPKTGIIMS